MKTTICLSAILLGISFATCTMAQDTVPAPPVADPKTQPAKDQPIDLSVPESPAFTVLGVTPQTVTRPASPRALATSLLNGVDPQGNFQTGLALDTVPYLLFMGNSITVNDYRNSTGTRFLSNTQVSFATTKGSSDDKSLRLAF